jgi:Uma2 family endonuclease
VSDMAEAIAREAARMPQIRRLTVAQYHRAAEAGVFAEGERIELIDGEVLIMPPIGADHVLRHATLTRYLIERLGNRVLVVPQGSFPLGRHNEPQPDFALFHFDEAMVRRKRLPKPRETIAYVEIAASSLAFDLGRKRELYASYGIVSYLVVDLVHNVLVFHRLPRRHAYAEQRTLTYGDTFVLDAFPDVELAADPFLDLR